MATKKQIAANRRNARKSTGPQTPQGKATASLNALRHGLRARTVILPRENPEEFDQIHAALQDHYRPQSAADQYLVDQAAIAQWKLVRAEAFEADCYDEEPSAKARAALFDRMTQVTGRLERAYFKAYKELERIKTLRQKPPELPKTKTPEDERPANLDVAWVNPETGERQIFYRRRNGQDVMLPDHPAAQPVEPGPGPPAGPVEPESGW